MVCFNEAAGIHRRKPDPMMVAWERYRGFNEAAGFTGGNTRPTSRRSALCWRFNEAAGIHRRKPDSLECPVDYYVARLQ